MVTIEEYCDAQNECSVLLESLEMAVDYAGKLIGFTGIHKEDDNGNVIELQPCASEHFESLVKTAKQISSYSDRLINKLALFKTVIKHISVEYNDARNSFYSTLEKSLCSFARPIQNEDGTVLPNKLVSIRIDDSYKRTGTDVVEVTVASLEKSDPQLFMIMPFDSNSRMKVVYNNNIIHQVDLGDGEEAAKSVVGCILSRM